MIIALFGPPGAGKDTVGKILSEQYAYRRVAFADKVRELALKLCGNELITWRGTIGPLKEAVKLYGWEETKRESGKARKILERVGDGCREVLGKSVWIDKAVEDIDFDCDNVVVTDMRKSNERAQLMIRGMHGDGYQCWHITRNSCEKRPFDEWKLEWATATIENNGTVEELAKKVRELMNGLTSPPASSSQR